MSCSKHAVTRFSRLAWRGAVLLAVGCSGAADETAGDPASSSSDLRAKHLRPPITILRDLRHVHIPPPHRPPHPGHGHGSGTGGAPGSAGSGTGTGTGGSQTNGGASSGAGGSFDVGGALNGGATSFGGSAGFGTGGSINDPCGDGIQYINPCDDGNTISGDGCSATCEVEPGYVCSTPGEPCRQPRCGDGFQDSIFIPGPSTDPGIGGSAGDPTQGGTAGFGAGGAAPGGTYYYEQCDDANAISGDGCSDTCQVEPGFVCSTPGEACRQPSCGDGIVDYYVPEFGIGGSAGSTSTGGGGEATGFGGAGGSTSTGFGGRSPATGGTPVGGDVGAGGSAVGGDVGAGGSAGTAYYSENCDDSNAVSGDGCDSTCHIEPGYECPYSGGPCRKPRCGDGIVDYYYPDVGAGGSTSVGGSPGAGGVTATAGAAGAIAAGGGTSSGVEQCDDGNNVSGDGCSATCTLE